MIDIKKYGVEPFGATPNERQVAHYKIAKKLFIHFGVNTFTDFEWGSGKEPPNVFAPTELDTDQWIKIAKNAGFELVILTAKHHDGFCLWPSKYTEQSVKNSTYKSGKGDIVREFTDSCRKYGIKAGLYISPWDVNSLFWGTSGYNTYYANQLEEVLTQYGELHEIWWDGAGSKDADYDWTLWESLVRKYQPKAAIFGAMGAAPHIDLRWVGNERGFAGETHYASIDPQYIINETPDILNSGQIGAKRYIPSETDVSSRPGWFYHREQDGQVKTAAEISEIWFNSVGRNSMMLFSFPPDRRGLVFETDAKNAIESHKNISKMLSLNFAEDAEISGDVIEMIDEDDGERALVREGYVFDIKLPKAQKINVFIVGELIEAGERISEFKLESIGEDGEAVLLARGTSVGHCRALRFDEDNYSHLRFTVLGAMATPLIRAFGLHFFESHGDTHSLKREGDLVSKVDAAEDKKSAVVAFGGIYPFDHVEFCLTQNGSYELYAFNGQDFILVMQGESLATEVIIDLPKAIEGSYQIKIKSDVKIDFTRGISVKKK